MTLQELIKISALNPDVKLRPHQQEVVDAISKRRKAIIAHGTGTGKTLSSIASFENLRNEGKANRALIVVPSSLRDNYADNIKRFTNSSYNIYGAKGDKSKTYIDEPSDSDYNIISYDMYRKNPEKIKELTGADTLIVDEVHKARNESSKTYESLSNYAGRYNNVITLTGSVVNNTPSDVSPLLDSTFGVENDMFGGRAGFEKNFIRENKKRNNRKGQISTKYDNKELVHKKQLAKMIGDKILYLPHSAVSGQMPAKIEETVKVPMSRTQKQLYMYTLDQMDPLTKKKILNNMPVSQKEMGGMFVKMLQARKVMTDPAQLHTPFLNKDPYEYSPKIRRAIDDLTKHLGSDPEHKAVVYGNLVSAQLDAYRKSLDNREIPYSTFMGVGNKGNSPAERQQSLAEYMKGKNRVLLLSSAGAEGLDLKGSTMMQLLEGHYNPERIQQAEARVVRMGDTPKNPIQIKKYVSYMKPNLMSRMTGGRGQTSADEYIYAVARRKDELNQRLRDVLDTKKKKSILERIGIKR